MGTPILSRKRDLAYLIYFCISVPMAFSMFSIHSLSFPSIRQTICLNHRLSYSKSPSPHRRFPLLTTHVTVMDLQPLYPTHLIPTFILKLGSFYVKTYNDQFFIEGNTPPFMKAFLWSELLYQVPTGIWAIQALLKGKRFFVH